MMAQSTPPRAVIVEAVRTASGRGDSRGILAGVRPAELLATALLGVTDRVGVAPREIDDVIAGCVLQIREQSFNIARTAALAAGFPESVPGITIDRHAGSSQQAIQFAVQGVVAGAYDAVIACGVESMSRVRTPAGSYDTAAVHVPLRQRYPEALVSQGVAGELVCARWHLAREELDEYAARSHARAAKASSLGYFDRETVPVDVHSAFTGMTRHRIDETIRPVAGGHSLAAMKPAFYTDEDAVRFPEIAWSITRGNSSQRADGAAAALIMSSERAAALGLRARARMLSAVVTGSDALLMMSGVVPATQMALDRVGLRLDDIDVFEIDETFAAIPLAWNREFGADDGRVNARGGAISLGNPLGAVGVRMLTTMLTQLEDVDGRFGLQVTSAAGGMASAMIIERMS
jgi:acetyl-CoA acyltransferase